MKAVLLVLPLLVFFAAGWVASRASLHAARAAEKRELGAITSQHERVLRLVMQHMDVEPFARVVWDELITIPTHPPLEGKK